MTSHVRVATVLTAAAASTMTMNCTATTDVDPCLTPDADSHCAIFADASFGHTSPEALFAHVLAAKEPECVVWHKGARLTVTCREHLLSVYDHIAEALRVAETADPTIEQRLSVVAHQGRDPRKTIGAGWRRLAV